MPITNLDNLDLPELKLYSSLRNSDEYIVCDSEKVVLKLLKSTHQIISILGDKTFYSKHHELTSKHFCYQAPRKILSQIVGHKIHQSVMAIAKRPEYQSLSNLDDNICILNGVTSPENVGNIIRSLCAFNIKSLIIDSKSVTPYMRRAIRVSMGNIFEMKIHATDELEEAIGQLQKSGVQVIGTANEEGSISISKLSFSTKSAFIIGSEGHGMDDSIKKICDQMTFIPITDHVLHLNANNAAAIMAYELSKQLKLV